MDTIDYVLVFCEECNEEYQIPEIEGKLLCPICLSEVEEI